MRGLGTLPAIQRMSTSGDNSRKTAGEIPHKRNPSSKNEMANNVQ